MQRYSLRLASLLLLALAAVVSVDITPDAAEMLLARGEGDNSVRIEDVYYSCVNGNAFAMVRNGAPAEGGADGYDVVEEGGLKVYVPKDMSFENDVPKIRVFPRKTGARDVGVPNTID